jgi:hypothetical protein
LKIKGAKLAKGTVSNPLLKCIDGAKPVSVVGQPLATETTKKYYEYDVVTKKGEKIICQ